MESIQVEIPITPVKKTRTQQRCGNSPPSTTILEEKNDETNKEIEEGYSSINGATCPIDMESFGTLDLNKIPIEEESWETEDQFAHGFTAALLGRSDGDDDDSSMEVDHDDEGLACNNLLSSQSSFESVNPNGRSGLGLGGIEGSFVPVQPEIVSQYSLKNQDLVDGKFSVGDRDNISSILKQKLCDAALERQRKRLKRLSRRGYRPKVVHNLGLRMEPKTPTKKMNPKKPKTKKMMKKNVTLDESSVTTDLNHVIHVAVTSDHPKPSESERESSCIIDVETHTEDGTGLIPDNVVERYIEQYVGFSDVGFLRKKKRTTIGKRWEAKDYSRFIEPSIRKIYKKKRMVRRRMEVKNWQQIALKFQANYLKRRYAKRRIASISQKKFQKIFDANQFAPCFIYQSEELKIEESLAGLVSILESDSFQLLKKSKGLLKKSKDKIEEKRSDESNNVVLVCYQENEKHGDNVEQGIVPHVNVELGIVPAADDKDGNRQTKLGIDPHVNVELGMVPATDKKKGKRQTKLEKLDHGELVHPWKLQLWNGVKEGGIHDENNSEFWRKEREFFQGRIDLFLGRMRIILGNREFSEWDGSVVDSIVGVYLTQNVSDNLSSSAFISLAADFPCQQPISNRELTEANPRPQQSKILQIEEYVENETTPSSCEPSSTAIVSTSTSNRDADHQLMHYHVDVPYDEFERSPYDIIENNSLFYFNDVKKKRGKGKDGGPKTISIEGGNIVPAGIYWDFWKRTLENSHGSKKGMHQMDAINWEAVRQAEVEEIADAIKGRGQHRIIARRIKEFLNDVKNAHGEIDLEWLRLAPAERVMSYLATIEGIGLKSVECVRLLALRQIAFPVDVNVGRIVIRLGWVPMQPLPEDVQIHVLNQLPVMDTIQKYLWPRLKKLSHKELYELHYHLITFGKVFCTKRKPNCFSCPMKNECKYYLSAYASAKHAALPNSTESRSQNQSGESHQTVGSDHVSFGHDPRQNAASSSFVEYVHKMENLMMRECEPIIELPDSPQRETSPEPEYEELGDIEDLFMDKPWKIPATTIPSTMDAFRVRDVSLVPFMTPDEASSIPARRLKEVERLRTKHSVYEIRDDNPLFGQLKLERRHPKDCCPYLFAMCTPVSQPDEDKCGCNGDGSGKTCLTCSTSLITQDDDTDMVQGTIMIPCRTATRGSFPLNGTYFQINEVFADHESSLNPIKVHRDLLWNQPTREVYCGTGASTILKGLSLLELSACFTKQGFICVRAFDRKSRTPEPLHRRFHLSTVNSTPKKRKKKPEEKKEEE